MMIGCGCWVASDRFVGIMANVVCCVLSSSVYVCTVPIATVLTRGSKMDMDDDDSRPTALFHTISKSTIECRSVPKRTKASIIKRSNTKNGDMMLCHNDRRDVAAIHSCRSYVHNMLVTRTRYERTPFCVCVRTNERTNERTHARTHARRAKNMERKNPNGRSNIIRKQKKAE